jgi:hypothetical protein
LVLDDYWAQQTVIAVVVSGVTEPVGRAEPPAIHEPDAIMVARTETPSLDPRPTLHCAAASVHVVLVGVPHAQLPTAQSRPSCALV